MSQPPERHAHMGILITPYLIRPNEVLRQRLTASGSDLVDVFDHLVVWSKTQGHRCPWRDEDRIAQIKLLFVADVRTDFADDAEFGLIFGDFPIAISTFDRFWVLERIDDEREVDDVVAQIEPAIAREFQPTGRPLVDDWIAELQRGNPSEQH